LRDGVVRSKNYENIHDGHARRRRHGDADAGGLEANKKLIEKIINDQRAILAAQVTRTSPSAQMWALYTEVQKYYDAGLKVPDDVTRCSLTTTSAICVVFPTPEERAVGGIGIYYHMDMNGGPFSHSG